MKKIKSYFPKRAKSKKKHLLVTDPNVYPVYGVLFPVSDKT